MASIQRIRKYLLMKPFSLLLGHVFLRTDLILARFAFRCNMFSIKDIFSKCLERCMNITHSSIRNKSHTSLCIRWQRYPNVCQFDQDLEMNCAQRFLPTTNAHNISRSVNASVSVLRLCKNAYIPFGSIMLWQSFWHSRVLINLVGGYSLTMTIKHGFILASFKIRTLLCFHVSWYMLLCTCKGKAVNVTIIGLELK
jgi:hypothetical protein